MTTIIVFLHIHHLFELIFEPMMQFEKNALGLEIFKTGSTYFFFNDYLRFLLTFWLGRGVSTAEAWSYLLNKNDHLITTMFLQQPLASLRSAHNNYIHIRRPSNLWVLPSFRPNFTTIRPKATNIGEYRTKNLGISVIWSAFESHDA